jgi:predicted ATPase
MAEQHKPLVYFSYSNKDAERVEQISHRLEGFGFQTWMYTRDIHAGELWQTSILHAIEAADFFLVFLSAQYGKGGFLQRELERALEMAKTKKGIYIIPVRLEDVRPPEELLKYQWIDLQEPQGFSQLVRALRSARTYRLPQPTVPQELLDACRAGDCVLYAGAGVAADTGFPTWQPFVNNLVAWAVERKFVDETYGQSLAALARQGQLDSVADSVVNAVKERKGQKELNKYLRQTFIEPQMAPSELHRILKNIPFSAALTTNFDIVLETLFSERNRNVFSPMDTEGLLTAFSKRDFFILKLYGDVDRPETLLISRPEFEDAVRQNVAFSQFMENLFFNRTILFLGASMLGIETYLDAIRFKSGTRNHYALVEVQDDTYLVEADQLKRRYGIQVIPFTTQSDYAEVLEFVRVLEQATGLSLTENAKGISGSEKGTVSQSSFLKRVTLENIGPFESLSLELDRKWNILLGDNGVGKSSILKAIALGIAGEDAQLYADRLIRSGQTHAAVLLETNTGKTYQTEILRMPTGPAQVISRGGRMLEGEGWLTLGFPPLRSMGWEQLRGPQLEEGKRRPTPDDIVPLIMGEPDPRCNRLKQWILNLDYRSAKKVNQMAGESERFQKIMQRFFETVGQLAAGVRIEFQQVDAERGRIMIRTDDGEVPIEAMSQGTISLIGWVGVLLQRLYEVFDDLQEVSGQYALVLIDEIDAHMHPEWQNNLVTKISEFFPNVQFVATTHSPLIVGGLPAAQVFRFVREEQGAITQLDVEPGMTMGRADQILTGALFGLPTTFDQKTLEEIEKYQKLLGNKNRTPTEEKEFRSLERILEFRIPLPEEMPTERRTRELLSALLKEDIGDKHPNLQEELLQRAEKLVLEIEATRGRKL